MPSAIPSGYYPLSPVTTSDDLQKEELNKFEKFWLENGAAELERAHFSAIAGHLLTISLYGVGSPELFQAIERELLRNHHEKLNDCSLVNLKWIVTAFAQRDLGSTELYQAIHDRLMANDGAYIGQYIPEWQTEVSYILTRANIDTTHLNQILNR